MALTHKAAVIAAITSISLATSSYAAFVTADNVTLNQGSAYFSEQNLISINGLDLGADNTLTADDFYTQTFNPAHSWVTNAAYPSYFSNNNPAPVLTFGFDQALDIDQLAVWGYVGFDNTNGIGNSARQGTIQFSTDGTNFGPLIDFTVDSTLVGDGASLTSFDTQQDVIAARITFTDNYSNLNGGDRVGANLIAFNTAVQSDTAIVPTPSAASLTLISLAALILIRKRKANLS
ncbi:hypothetical protein [Poriferisphaera sp. WC338]|uniref:hypothetical protein n=1 Tax=Poriferisphaera sp. WC338 TaxID=3425129 RepID=UPI003D81B6B8